LSGDAGKATVKIGKILAPHGVAGLLKVYPYTDFPERCALLKEVTVEQKGKRRRKTVEKAVVYGRFWLIKFAGVDTREEAALLAGAVLLIPKAERIPLPAGVYYVDQVVGLKVYTTDGELLGRVTRVISTGGHDLYAVKKEPNRDGAEFLVPAVKKFVKSIDPDGGKMVVELPDGLLDL
jgi:16S rRNA processing protein RimM